MKSFIKSFVIGIGKGCVWVLIGFVVVSVYNTANAQDLTQAQVEQVVRAAVNDPDSVVFDSSYVVRPGDGTTVYCGTVRAKNVYGGVVRASFVIDPTYAEMPFFVGPTPLAWIGRRLCNK